MKLIIDISEEDFEWFEKFHKVDYYHDRFNRAYTAIANSTPLTECEAEDCISRKEVDRLASKYLQEPTDNHIAFYEHFLDLPSVYPKNDKLSDGYYRREYLRDLGKDICHQICVCVHGKDGEECPCLNQTTSCLANIRVCDADKAIGKVIDRKIDELPNAYPKSDVSSCKLEDDLCDGDDWRYRMSGEDDNLEKLRCEVKDVR